MKKRFSSSLDPRGIQAPTRYSYEKDKPNENRPGELTKGGNYKCPRSECNKIYQSEEKLAQHLQRDHPPKNRDNDPDPRPYQGGLPSLGKKR
jgi:hypothetical protein